MAKTGEIRFRIPSVAEIRDAGRLAITRAALQAISGIKQDTARGIDARGAFFAPYTARYAAARLATGRRASPVTLNLTGALMRGLRLLRVDSPRRAIIGWEGQHTTRDALAPKRAGGRPVRTVSYRALVTGLQRKRRFFAVERRERVEQVRRVYIAALRKATAEALRR